MRRGRSETEVGLTRGVRGRGGVRARVGAAIGAWIGAGIGLGVLVGAPVPAAGLQELPAEDRVVSPEFVDLWSVGELEGEAWETFGRVRAVAFGPEGDLFVLDGMRQVVVQFDADGEFVREIGGPGEGPGEFQGAAELAVLDDGTVVVGDPRRRVFHLFSPDGTWIDGLPVEAGGVLRMGDLHAIPGRRAFYEGGGGMSTLTVSIGSDPSEMGGRPIRLGDLETGAVDVHHRGWTPVGPDQEGAGVSSSGGTVSFSLASALPPTWEPSLWITPLPDGGLAVADTATWSVRLLSPAGSTRTTLRRPSLEPIPATDELVAADRERRRAELESTGGGDQLERAVIEASRYWHEIPVIEAMRGSPAGVLWVERARAPGDDEVRVDLVRWDGSYLGTVVDGPGVPDAFGPQGRAAWVEIDDLGVTRVQVRRIPDALR